MEKQKQLDWFLRIFQIGQSGGLVDLSTNSLTDEALDAIFRQLILISNADAALLVTLDNKDQHKIERTITHQVDEAFIQNHSDKILEATKNILDWNKTNGDAVELLNQRETLSFPLNINKCLYAVIYLQRQPDHLDFNNEDQASIALFTALTTCIVRNFLSAGLTNKIVNLNHAEKVIFDDDERLNSILASLDDVVWSIETSNFSTTYMSPAAIKVYGWPAAKFYDTQSFWMEIIHDDDRSDYISEIYNLFNKGLLHIKYRVKCADGKIKWLSDQITVIYDKDNTPLRMDGISRDITSQVETENSLKVTNQELRDAYQKLQALQGQLLQSEKMASIGQLAAGVAHEINNPIGYVYSNLGTLQKYLVDIFKLIDDFERVTFQINDHPEVIQEIKAIEESVDLAFLKTDIVDLMGESREGITRVKKIVQDLKDFSHADSEEEWLFTDIRKGIDSTLNIVNNEIKYKTEVVKRYEDIPDIECLPAQLNQVFMNMFVNAAQAMDSLGKIIVTVKKVDSNIHVTFEDNGKGIDPKHIKNIFDPFFTTKPVGTGTGLGLSVSYNIIQKHHGKIEVTSEIGVGTKFNIVLPIKQSDVATF